MNSDQLDVEEVMKYWREIAGQQTQQIVMLRAALAKATHHQDATDTGQPPVPDIDD